MKSSNYPTSKELQKFASEQLNILFKLPPASGTGVSIVQAIVDAAVAAVAEQQASQRTLGLPRKDR